MSLRRLSGMIPYAGQYTTSGAMSFRASFYTKGTRNASGTFPADVLFATSWAAFRALTGRELDQARSITQTIQVLITVPYISGLTQAMTVTLDSGTDTYQIDYITDPDGRKVEQRLYCSLINQTVGN